MAVSFDVKNLNRVTEDDVRNLGIREVEERLLDSAQKSQELWDEYKQKDAKISSDEANAIRLLNDNMTVLKKRTEEIREFDAMFTASREELERQRHPDRRKGMFSPGTEGGRDESAGLTVGEVYVKSVAFTEFNASRKGSPEAILNVGPQVANLRQKALLDTTDFAPQAIRSNLILPTAERQVMITDLIPQGTTNQTSIVYMEETTATNGAAFVAEGDAKPESALSFTERTSPVRKVATVLPVTEEMFEDVPQMRDYVNARLGQFMDLARENYLLNGSGVAPEFTGMLNVAGIQTQAKGADPTPDAIYKAIVKIQVGAFLQPSGVVLHPNDWTDIRLLRTADGQYIWGSPADPGPARIWGLPVVSTVAATENTGVVAAFDSAMMIWRRTGVSFAVSDQHNDFFITNKLMLRVEERLAFVVYRPAAICTVTGI